MKAKKLLYFNQSAYDSRSQQIQNAESHFSNLLDEFFKLNIFPSLDDRGFYDLIINGSAYLKKRLSDELSHDQLSFGRFRLKRSSAVDMLDLPDFTLLDQLCLSASSFVSELNYYTIAGKTLKLDQSKMDQLKQQYSIVGKNVKAIELVDHLEAVVGAMNKFNESFKALLGGNLDSYMTNAIFVYDPRDGKVSVAQDFFTRNASKLSEE